MLVKAQLASRIAEIIKRRRLTQVAAAEITGLPQPKPSGLLRGQFRGVSKAKMLACLPRMGRDLRIVVGPARRRGTQRRAVWLGRRAAASGVPSLIRCGSERAARSI